MGDSSIIIFLGDISFLIFIIIFVCLNLPFQFIFVSYLFSKLFNVFVSLNMFQKKFGLVECKIIPSSESFKMIKESFPFAVNRFVTLGFNRFDILLLSYWGGAVSVGLYNAAITLVLRTNSFVKPFIFALFPALSKNYQSDREQYLRYMKKSTMYILCLAIPVFVIFFLGSDMIITLLYGSKFNESVRILQILSIMIVFKFVNPLFANALTASGNQIKRTHIIVASFILNIILNIFLIPLYKIKGAAFSSLITEVFITIVISLNLVKIGVGIFIEKKSAVKLFLILLTILILSYYLKNLPLFVFIIIVFSIVFINYLLFDLISIKEIKRYYFAFKTPNK